MIFIFDMLVGFHLICEKLGFENLASYARVFAYLIHILMPSSILQIFNLASFFFFLQSCIKVAADFVSPENVSVCIRLAEESRVLPHDHRSQEDKLEVQCTVVRFGGYYRPYRLT